MQFALGHILKVMSIAMLQDCLHTPQGVRPSYLDADRRLPPGVTLRVLHDIGPGGDPDREEDVLGRYQELFVVCLWSLLG